MKHVFKGNYLDLWLDDEEQYRRALRFGEAQLSYTVRKYLPRENTFTEEVIRRYWGYPDSLKLRTFRGLWPRVKRFFGLQPKPYCEIDFDEREVKFLRDYQLDALYHILNQMEECGCSSLQACTGSGKTEVAVAVYKAVKPNKCFFLSLNTDLLIQAKERFQKYGEEAGLVNKDHFEVDAPVVCCTVQTLYRALMEAERVENPYATEDELDEEVRGLLEETPVQDKLELVKEFKNSELVILDEIQHVPARTVWTCAIANAHALRLGLSATPWRDQLGLCAPLAPYDGRDLDIYCAMGDPVPRKITSSELVKRGYLVPAEITFVHYHPPWADKYSWQRGSAQLYMKVKRELYTDPIRNRLIAKLAELAPKPFLCLVKEVKHGEILHREMRRRGLHVAFVYGAVDPDRRARIFEAVRAGRLDGIIATTLADEIVAGGVSLNTPASMIS